MILFLIIQTTRRHCPLQTVRMKKPSHFIYLLNYYSDEIVSNHPDHKRALSTTDSEYEEALAVTVHTAGRIQEHADEDVNSNNSL